MVLAQQQIRKFLVTDLLKHIRSNAQDKETNFVEMGVSFAVQRFSDTKSFFRCHQSIADKPQ